ncbi:MAG: MATE family efflux transporter [Lachnospiraceae bacterium]
MEQTQSFTQGKIFSPLIRFAVPVLFALFLQTMYGAVDLLIVGQFGGASAEVYVSAVSTGSQVMQTLTVIITGLAMGLTVFVAREIGAGMRAKAGKIIGSGICLFAGMALVVSILMVWTAPALASMMQAPEEALSQTISYIVICSVGAVFIVAYNLVGSIFRGIGDSKMPLLTVAIACVFNIAGDLLLVAVFQLGASGAAIATVAAQAISVLISLLIIRKRKLPFDFTVKDIRPNKTYIGQILKLGIPIACQDFLVSISFLVIMAIVNSLGLTASAGVGVAEKLCGFLMLVPSAYMQSMSAFVAQNMGAGKPDRARKALLYGIASSLAVSIVMFYFTFFHGNLLAGVFAKDTRIILAAADYLKAYAIDCLLTSFLFCFIGYFNGCSRTTFVMLQGIMGAFGVRIPVSWFMSRQAEVTLFHIGLATPASSVVQIVLCGVYFIILTRKQKRGELYP